MLTVSFPALAFDTNCYVLAPAAGAECVVIDPGIGVLPTLRDVLAEYRLRPAAVMLTHGHLDHVYAVTPVCQTSAIPAYIHGDDRYRLVNPIDSLDSALVGMLEAQFGTSATWTEPSDVVLLGDRDQVEIAGLTFTITHAPGHTEGSVLISLADIPDGLDPSLNLTSTVVSGDVLFAGSIGRTDLPGGSSAAMTRTLREVVLDLPDSALVLPGHGPATAMSIERATNPYLQGLSA